MSACVSFVVKCTVKLKVVCVCRSPYRPAVRRFTLVIITCCCESTGIIAHNNIKWKLLCKYRVHNIILYCRYRRTKQQLNVVANRATGQELRSKFAMFLYIKIRRIEWIYNKTNGRDSAYFICKCLSSEIIVFPIFRRPDDDDLHNYFILLNREYIHTQTL